MIDENGSKVKMSHMKAILLLILTGVASVCAAQGPSPAPAGKPAEKKTSLPAQLLSARTMCIKVRSAPDADVAEARRELKAWNRFQVVEDCAQADITLWIQARELPEAEICGAVIQVTANSGGAILWTGNSKCKKSTKGLIGLLVRNLRKAMATQAPKKSKPPAG